MLSGRVIEVKPQERNAESSMVLSPSGKTISRSRYFYATSGSASYQTLVRGIQTDSIEQKNLFVPSDGYQIDTMIVTPLVALPMLLVLILIVFFKPVKKPPNVEEMMKNHGK